MIRIKKQKIQKGSISVTVFVIILATLVLSYLYLNFNKQPNKQPNNVVSATESDTEPPTSPPNVGSNFVTSTQASFHFNGATDNMGVAGYYIFRDGVQIATIPHHAAAGVALDSGLDPTSWYVYNIDTIFIDYNLQPSTTYKYRIRAFDAAGNVSNELSYGPEFTTLAPSNKGNITGYVWGKTEIFPFKTVKINLAGKGVKSSYTLNEVGKYWFTDLNPGTYTLTFQAPGYESQKASVTVSGGVYTVKNVILTKK